MLCKKKRLENKKKEGIIMIRNYVSVKFVKAEPFDILPMPKGRGFLDTNDTCLLK